MNHKCPVNGCEAQLPREILMCAPHWRMVPDDLAAAVSKTWRGASRGRGSVDDYLKARAAAVSAVNAKFEGGRMRIMGLIGRIGMMGMMFLVGAVLAIAAVLAVGWVNAFRAWFVVALLIMLVILFGLAAQREGRDEKDAMDERSAARPTCVARPLPKQEENLGPLFMERGDIGAVREEINRIIDLGKEKQ